MNDSSEKIQGFCKLCREKELELYGTIGVSDEKHAYACKAAGCKHPIKYNTGYEWENCAICGKSEKEHYVKTSFAMLLWHTDIGTLCEDCYFDYDENID